MKKITLFLSLIITLIGLGIYTMANSNLNTEEDVFGKLMDAERYSGIFEHTKRTINVDGDLNLPKEYKGVTISYVSGNKEIITDNGVVTRPNYCWIKSKDQQGLNGEKFEGLNDNHPILITATLKYKEEELIAKFIFIVSPNYENNYICDDSLYKGNR